MRDENLTAEHIERIEVECTTYCKGHVGWPYVPRGVASAQINMYYALAVMALDRAAMIEQFREERLNDPRILAFIPRIHVSTDPKLDAMGNRYRYATRLRVVSRPGSRYEREMLHRPGSSDAPLSDNALRGKFKTLASHALDDVAIEEVQAAIKDLDRSASTHELIALLDRPSAVAKGSRQP
jgi:2-methylcitrate dehydratase PrpD